MCGRTAIIHSWLSSQVFLMMSSLRIWETNIYSTHTCNVLYEFTSFYKDTNIVQTPPNTSSLNINTWISDVLVYRPPAVQEQERCRRTDPNPSRWCRRGSDLLGNLRAPHLCGKSWWWGILGSTHTQTGCHVDSAAYRYSIRNSVQDRHLLIILHNIIWVTFSGKTRLLTDMPAWTEMLQYTW